MPKLPLSVFRPGGGGGGGEGDLILHTITSGKLYLKVSPGTDSCYISRLSPFSLSK